MNGHELSHYPFFVLDLESKTRHLVMTVRVLNTVAITGASFGYSLYVFVIW